MKKTNNNKEIKKNKQRKNEEIPMSRYLSYKFGSSRMTSKKLLGLSMVSSETSLLIIGLYLSTGEADESGGLRGFRNFFAFSFCFSKVTAFFAITFTEVTPAVFAAVTTPFDAAVTVAAAAAAAAVAAATATASAALRLRLGISLGE